jgi:hypothetical protein
MNEFVLGFLQLMTPSINKGVVNQISIITIKSLIDLGYTVDENKAEEYTIPGVSASTSLRAQEAASITQEGETIDLSQDWDPVDVEALKKAIQAPQSSLRGGA